MHSVLRIWTLSSLTSWFSACSSELRSNHELAAVRRHAVSRDASHAARKRFRRERAARRPGLQHPRAEDAEPALSPLLGPRARARAQEQGAGEPAEARRRETYLPSAVHARRGRADRLDRAEAAGHYLELHARAAARGARGDFTRAWSVVVTPGRRGRANRHNHTGTQGALQLSGQSQARAGRVQEQVSYIKKKKKKHIF